MTFKREILKAVAIVGVFACLYFIPLDNPALNGPHGEGLRMAQDYARLHALSALVPALVLAGAITVFLNRAAVLKYLGPQANPAVAYGVGSVSGAILSVCSCGVLPLFAGIYRMGAGLGPACAFLYAGPAINVLAIVLTAHVFGAPIGVARAVGAVSFGVIIGLAMRAMFRKHEKRITEPARDQQQDSAAVPAAAKQSEKDNAPLRSLWRTGGVMGMIVLALVFLNWTPSGFRGVLRCCTDGKTTTTFVGTIVNRTATSVTVRDVSGKDTTAQANLLEQVEPVSPLGYRVYQARYVLAGLAGIVLVAMLAVWYRRSELKEWALSTWTLAGQILPPLLVGVLLVGALLGSHGREGLIPGRWIAQCVGGNSVGANFAASLTGALMYFATLTEVPIVQGLMNSGMGGGPALAMLLAGPAVSLPSLVVLVSIMGWRKTLAFLAMVVLLAAATGTVFGMFVP